MPLKPSFEIQPVKASLDLSVFIPAFVISVATIAFLIFDKENASMLAGEAMASVTGNWGWLFSLVGFASLIVCIWLAFGRYGNVKLGREGEEPEFSELSWAAMMFSAGIGIGLMNWSFVEPVHYFATPPMGIEPFSTKAAEWGHMYALFHWSFVPWALYTVAAVPVAYMLYVERKPYLRLSAACGSVLGRQANGFVGSIIDTLVILGLIGGAGTSLGFGVPLVSAFTADLLNLPDTWAVKAGVIILWTLIFGLSAYKGLKAGIRILSDINILLAVAIVVFILIVGPTVFILSLSANSVGLLLDNFMHMSFWLDPIDKGGFPDAWTIFYWAWWIAFAPMMGLFFGRISRGRTIKQMVVGIIAWGTLGCGSFMAICGAYTLDLQLSGAMDVSTMIRETGIPQTVLAIVHTLPWGGLVSLLFTMLSFVFIATTLDSAAFVLASVSTKNLKGTEEPAKYNRLIWAFVLAMVPLGLMYVDGLQIVQSSTIVTALPVIPVLIILILSLIKSLKRDFGNKVTPSVISIDDD